MIVRHLLGTSASSGFYVDVGAHHPTIGSNTCHFRWLGWRGINIEPQPGLLALFSAQRPEDINLQLAIGSPQGRRTLFVPEAGASLASFHRSRASMIGTALQAIEVDVRPLAEVLDDHMPRQQRLDFLNVDAEGADLEVLESNDWERYRPRVICVETAADDQAVQNFLDTREYDIVATNAIIIGEVVELFALDRRCDWRRTL